MTQRTKSFCLGAEKTTACEVMLKLDFENAKAQRSL